MKHNSMIKKMLSAALICAFAVTPIIMEMPAAQAAPSGWTQNGNDRERKGYQTITGKVVKIDSDRRILVRVSLANYRINLSSRLPRNLSEGDSVRVYGHKTSFFVFDDASVEIVGNNSGDHGYRYETFVGTVTKIENDRRFDIRVDRKTYNVKVADRVSYRLNRGDEVRVTGRRSGNSDINDARVEILRDNSGNHGYRHETFVGTVTKIENDRRFDIRVDRKTYNVKVADRVSYRLNRGDEVRVTGQRSGDSDINDARVEILRENSGNRDYETFTGTVTKVTDSRRFDIRADGKTYNVNTVESLPRKLREGNIVRVSGRRSGKQDIDNARVDILRDR